MKKINLTAVVIQFSIIGIIAYFIIHHDQNKFEKLKREYKDVNKTDSINSSIIFIYFEQNARDWEHNQCIKLKDGNSYYFFVGRQVYIKDKKYFGEVVAPGVHLRKNPGSDTLIVDTGKEKYYYILSFYDASLDSASFIEKIFR